MERKLKDYIPVIFKGIGMGAADVIPGVSGGTIAFITGIYDELLSSIKNLPAALQYLVISRLNFKLFWKKLNGNFLLALLSGIALSFLSLARLISWLLRDYPVPVWSFFFGLILASVWFVMRDIKKWKISYFFVFAFGILAGYLISVVGKTQTPDDLWFIFLSGALAICAMILPGISGSFILYLLNKYEFMLGAINDLNITVILTFVGGAAIGLISFSYFLSWLLKHYRYIAIAFLGGLMFGSLNKIWPWKEKIDEVTDSNIMPEMSIEILYAAIMVVAGFSIIFLVDNVARKMTKKQSDSIENQE